MTGITYNSRDSLELMCFGVLTMFLRKIKNSMKTLKKKVVKSNKEKEEKK